MASALRLNPEQCRAVEHGEGPLLVIAGPGSGKTRVITQRIVHLLEGRAGRSDNPGAVRPENILALTFTDKAAAEMKRRVSEALPHLAAFPYISTFHAFCYHVLCERHFERRLLDKVDVWIFLRRRMSQLGLEFYQKLAEPGAFLHDLNEFFSRCQDELIEPNDFEAYLDRLEIDHLRQSAALDPAGRALQAEELRKKKELAVVFRRSRTLIEEAGYSSLGSLISETVRLWEREPLLLEHYRSRFHHVLVDEFQDTNYAQVELLRRLVARPYNITAVGDDDQAIYRFRGAAHGAFEMFDAAFPNAQKVYLHRNYRSTPRILRLADAVIVRNQRYEQKPALKPERDEPGEVFLVESRDYRSEAAWIAGEVERLARRGRSLGEIAILYRAHTHRNPLVEEFRRRKIPFTIRGLSILSTVIIRDLAAYLKVVHSPHDNISLTRVLLARHWRFPEPLALEVRRRASKQRCSLFTALETMEQTLFSEELQRTGFAELKTLLRNLKKIAERSPATTLLDQLTDRLGLRFLPGEADEAFLESFKKFLREWEGKSETKKLGEFMEYFQYFCEAGGQIEAPETKHSSNAVQMMTVHAAKGLEFPVVFVIGIAPQRFPHREQKPVIEFPPELRKGPAPPPDIHLQEERRLFYVAMTRAQDRLYVSSVVRPERKPSVFVDNLLSNPVLRARDIERIQVPEISPIPAPPPGVSPAPRSQRAGSGMEQPSLFGEVPPPVDTLYPDLAGWASQQPSLAPDGKLRLSATAIEDYLSCPLKFKLNHFLKIPTGPQAPLTFGNVMHRCVRHYFELRKRSLPRFEELEEFYLRAWKDAGFEDPYQEQAYKKAGIEQLRAFVEAQREREIRADQIRMEEYFQLDLGDVVLEGRIDQINPLGLLGVDGKRSLKPAVELVDYKTGKPRTQQDADKSLQLSIYALAARRVLGIDPARLTFYNLTNNEPVSTVRTVKGLEKAVEEVRGVAENVRSLLFAPTPGFVCKRCDFVPICPAHEETY